MLTNSFRDIPGIGEAAYDSVEYHGLQFEAIC